MITVELINQLKQKIESGSIPRDLVSDIIKEHINYAKTETLIQKQFFTHTIRALLHNFKEPSLQALDEVIDEINHPEKLDVRPISELPGIYTKKSEPVKANNICILYTKFVRLDFFKNTFIATKKDFDIPLFYLDYKDNKTTEIPKFDLNTTQFKKAILWQDNYYVIWDPKIDYYPIISDNKCVGPLTIDIEKFKNKYDAIIKYDDISFGYLKETDSFIKEGISDTYDMVEKVCCRKKRDYFSKKVVAVEDGGIPYIDLLPSLKKKIKGE